MKTHNLIASVAAIALTFASLSAINYNVTRQPAPAARSGNVDNVTNLAPVLVRPSAAERRAAALLTDVPVTGALISAGELQAQTAGTSSLNLLQAEAAMPYYSFGRKFGRVSKE